MNQTGINLGDFGEERAKHKQKYRAYARLVLCVGDSERRGTGSRNEVFCLDGCMVGRLDGSLAAQQNDSSFR